MTMEGGWRSYDVIARKRSDDSDLRVEEVVEIASRSLCPDSA